MDQSWADLNQMVADRDRALNAERALADDLADVLDRLWMRPDGVNADEIHRVLARYREARGL